VSCVVYVGTLYLLICSVQHLYTLHFVITRSSFVVPQEGRNMQ